MVSIKENNELYEDYFKYRDINTESYSEYELPVYIRNILPENKNAPILDIGCGFGQMLLSLRKLGYTNLHGIDLSAEAIDFCQKNKLNVVMVNDISDHVIAEKDKYELIIMSHVLEHIPKDKVIATVQFIKSALLKEGGAYLLMVPNAQSNTGVYWMYEDFTHHTLFTAGSAQYVLKAGGFTQIQFLDKDGVESAGTWYGKLIRRFFLRIYEFRLDFWNKITLSTFHRPSPRIYTFELKVLAR
jgi:2-polyprenyl-3-methyl-5-hydroxy-6-metoxy-1,4-benzoquinol methylase